LDSREEEILSKEDARCLPCSREEQKLASSKLDMLSNPMGSTPMRYGAWRYVRYKGKDGKSDTAQALRWLINYPFHFLH
jgi:hypothetical protein